MSNPTTPFSWQMPTATDLVTDLPADFEVFGQAVATSMGDLLGGANGYILSKASATDMDFTWIANDQGDITGVTAGNGISVTSPTGPVPTVAIDTTVTVDKTTAQTLTNKTLTSPALTTPTISTLTTNGDLVYGTGSGVLQRLGIGSTSNVLTVTGGVPVWAAPASGGMTLLSTTTLSGTSTVINVASGYINLFVVISGVTANTNYELAYRVNNIGGSGYYGNAQRSYTTATNSDPADTFVVFAPGSTSALSSSANNIFTALIENYDSNTKYKTFRNSIGITDNASALYQANSQWTLFDTTAMTSLKIMPTGAATFTAGTVEIYGVK
jgi:hypothetical protein